jgi:hypothetical protein
MAFPIDPKDTYDVTISGAGHADLKPRSQVILLDLTPNLADELHIDCMPKNASDGSFLDLTDIVRGDKIDVNREGQVSFFGEVIDVKQNRSNGQHSVRILAYSDESLLTNFPLNRVIYNGFRDNLSWELEADLKNDLKFGIKPLLFAEVFRPHGHYDARYTVDNFGAAGTTVGIIRNDGVNNDQVAVLFQAEQNTIEKLWVYIHDSEVVAAPATGPITLDFQDAVDDGAGTILPGGNVLTTRSGANAQKSVSVSPKESWTSVTTGLTYTSPSTITGSDLAWSVETSTTGSNLARTIVTAVAGTPLGHLKAVRIESDGVQGNITRIITDAPDAEAVKAPSGWVCMQFQLSATGVEGQFEVFVDQGAGRQVAAIIRLTSDTLKVVTGITGDEVETVFGPSLSATTKYYLFLRLDLERMTYDVWLGDETPGVFVKAGQNFDFFDRNTFTETPTEIVRYAVEVNDAVSSGDGIELGWVSGAEIGFQGSGRYPGAWTQVDFSDDPIEVNPGEWYSIVVRDPDAASTGIYNWGATVSTSRSVNATSFLYYETNDGGTTWTVPIYTVVPFNTPVEFPFVVEYSESWVPAEEEIHFIVDYDNDEVDWSTGTVRTGVVATPFYFGSGLAVPGDAMTGPGTFNVVRFGEYANPPQGGLIQSANEMRVPDVVDFIVKEFSSITLVAVDSSFNTAAFQVDSLSVKYDPALVPLRQLANRFGALFYLTAEAVPTFVFEPVKIITDIDVTNLQDNEYVLSMDRNFYGAGIGEEDALRLRTNTIGIKENITFSHFPAIGATPSTKFTAVAHDVETALGYDAWDSVEVFPKENFFENILEFAEAKKAIYGVQLIEGDIIVQGYWPLSPAGGNRPGRLDVNAIIRIIDPDLPNGLALTGIANVFKVQRILYDGITNRTKLTVSNRNLYRSSEEDLQVLRNVLNGVEDDDPRLDIPRVKTVAGSISASGEPTLYMALRFNSGELIDSLGYRRILCNQVVHDDGYVSYTAFFPAGIGTIASDVQRIDEIILYDDEFAGSAIVTADMSSEKDLISKFSPSRLHVTIYILDSDQAA